MIRIHFLNVENGDCSIIEHDDGRISVIDVCCARKNWVEQSREDSHIEEFSGVKGNFNQKAHPENPVEYLKNLKVSSIFRYIQTHPDMDHMDGIKDLFDSFEVLNFWDIKNSKKIDSFDNGKYRKEDWDFYKKIRNSEKNPKTLYYHSGDVNQYYADDGISILAPSRELCDEASKSGDYNDASYVLLLEVNNKKVIFAGDSGNKTWGFILKKYSSEVSDVDLLIAPHHGRKSGGNDNYLGVLKPKLTLFGNAASKDLDYASWNSKNLCHITNNQAGNVVVEISSGGMKVYVSNESFAKKYREKIVSKENDSGKEDESKKVGGKDYFHIRDL